MLDLAQGGLQSCHGQLPVDPRAPLAKLVYATDLKSVTQMGLPVQVRQGAPQSIDIVNSISM